MKTLLILLFGICKTEDSSNCVWNARVHGNEVGESFFMIGTETSYLILLLD